VALHVKNEGETMTEETLTTQETPEQQPATPQPEPASPAEAQTTEQPPEQEHMIPKSRFDEINTRLKKMESEAAKAAKAQAEAERKALEEQNKFQELYEKEKAEREKALAEMEALQLANLRREIAAKVKLPNGLASRLTGTTAEEIEADAQELLKAIPQAQPPKLDGRAGGGTGRAPSKTEAEIREEAAVLGVSFEHLKKQYGA
jgi:hypothetical protein